MQIVFKKPKEQLFPLKENVQIELWSEKEEGIIWWIV